MLISIHPLATKVDAIVFSVNIKLSSIDHIAWISIIKDATEESSLKIVDSDDATYHEKGQRDYQHIEKAWDSHY